MRFLMLFLALAVSITIPTSCQMDPCFSKSYFLTTYNNFMKDMDKNYNRYSASDWESKDKKIKSFVDDCYPSLEGKMTGEEKVDFWKKYVKYMILRHSKGAFKAIEKEDKDSVVEIYDEIMESFEDSDLEDLFKEFLGDDIEDAVDDVLKELNKWGDQLKDWLDRN